jgi:hypothetical protein
MLGVRLHGWHRLDTTGTTANDGDAIILPLLALIFLGPFSGMDNLALEPLHALDFRPLEVVQNARAM